MKQLKKVNKWIRFTWQLIETNYTQSCPDFLFIIFLLIKMRLDQLDWTLNSFVIISKMNPPVGEPRSVVSHPE